MGRIEITHKLAGACGKENVVICFPFTYSVEY
jgi:hypothetical protein